VLKIGGFLDFVHCLVLKKLENAVLQKLDVLLTSGSQLNLYVVLLNSYPSERKGNWWKYAECPTKFLPLFTRLLSGIF
jgi:hypothetical protein